MRDFSWGEGLSADYADYTDLLSQQLGSHAMGRAKLGVGGESA